MATYQSSHTGAEIDAAVDDVSTKLPLTGGTLTGALTVSADVTTTGDIYLANTKNIYSKDSGGTDRSLLYLAAANSVHVGYGTVGASGSTFIYSGNALSVRVGGTGISSNAVYIDPSRNIGIGTTSPSSKLHVAGGITATGSVTIGSCEISYANDKLNFSNGVVAVFSGSTAPSSSTGSDGDIYIQTS